FRGLPKQIRESFADILLDHQSVDNDLNGVILFLIEVDRFVEIMQHTVNAAADIAGLSQCLKLFLELAFAAANDRSKDHHTCAFRQGLKMAHDLIGSLLGDWLATFITIRYADRGE